MKKDTHDRLRLADKITLLGDLEHARHHAIRSMYVVENNEEKFWYQVKASEAEKLRRELQAKWANTGELDWCLVKVASRLKWLNEEVLAEDDETFSKIEDFADSLLSHALKTDLSGCNSCQEDQPGLIEEEITEEMEDEMDAEADRFAEEIDYQVIE